MDEKLYIKAIKYLTQRPHSEKEVRDYLLGKNKKYSYRKFQEKETTEEEKEERQKILHEKVEAALFKLKQQKFINDMEFAAWWIEQRSRFKPKGWRVIAMELKQKGIDKEIIETAHNSDVTTSLPGEKEQALELVDKRMKKYQGLDRNQLYQKLGGFLARRGFDLDIIRACIDEVIKKSV